jgi:hypothetical protein
VNKSIDFSRSYHYHRVTRNQLKYLRPLDTGDDMTLQELFDRAIKDQWFAPSYRAPLQTYVKRYAAALGQEPRSCPPTLYQLPDARVQELMLESANPDLQPRSVQAGINAILKLLHRGVDEGCLPPQTPPLSTIRFFRGPVKSSDLISRLVARADYTPYGLTTAWPFDLAYETAMYIQWCTPEVARGRPAKIRKGASSIALVEQVIGQVAAYAVNLRGMEKATLTLEALCQPSVLEEFAWWWIKRRGVSTSALFRKLEIMKTIVRYWYKDERSARGIVDLEKQLKTEAPIRRVRDKEGRELSLEELDHLARSLYPLNEVRLKRDSHLKAIMRHLRDSTGGPLPPRYGRFSHLAAWAGLSLIVKVLIHRPLRLGNIADLQFRHLKPLTHGGYEMVIPAAEMKNGKFMQRREWRERFPSRLLPELQEWLTLWRPRLLKLGQESPWVFLNTQGRPYSVNRLSKKIIHMSLRLTHDRPGGAVAWFPHNIRTTWTKEMLHAGLNPYVVKRILGDSFKVIDKHYGGYQDGQPSAFARQLAKEIEQGID